MSEFLTTKEVADLLRLKERKVYDLAARNMIPCVKATGKLLFPKTEINQWIQHKGASLAETAPRPLVILGSHDPLFEWTVTASGCGLPTFLNGSLDGFMRFKNREGIACGIHTQNPDLNDWNTALVETYLKQSPSILVHWAKRERGLVTKESSDISNIEDLIGKRLVARQPGAGAQVLLEKRLYEAGIATDSANYVRTVQTETEAALSVLEGEADSCFGLRCFADRYNLKFIPICEEYFDLVIDRHAYFEEGLQKLFEFTKNDRFSAEVGRYGGYDISGLGEVRINGCL
ncbi:MAG TPA: hypothetical protein DIC49_07670 [Gammaproteobacteria bacterium]|nr:hypothetical protein [Gammaproteobacteria bacterium]